MPDWKGSPRGLFGNCKRAYEIYKKEGITNLISKAYHKLEFQNIKTEIERLPIIVQSSYILSIRELQDMQREENNINDILDTAYQYQGVGLYESIEPMQHREELINLIQEVQKISPSTIMEIGTARGGTLYCWSRVFETSKIISVDISHIQPRTKIIERFDNSTNIRCIEGHSQTDTVKSKISHTVGPNHSIDFLFIDGGHKYDEVKNDFELYKDLVSDGGIIALHDIVPRDDRPHYGVNKFWNELKDNYDTKEIITNGETGGIGVVYL